jgi:hypothetical protein
MRLEPILVSDAGLDDPFYKIAKLAVVNELSLTNEGIDQIVYEG